MSPDFVISLGRKAVETVLMLAAPMLIAGLVVGLIISIFQAATQINEQTMTFIPKIVAVFVSLIIFGKSTPQSAAKVWRGFPPSISC